MLQNNCSGKHAGMLALALHLGAPTETYDEPGQPGATGDRQDNLSSFRIFRLKTLRSAVDGCGVPVFGITVKAMALMYARLVAPPPGV